MPGPFPSPREMHRMCDMESLIGSIPLPHFLQHIVIKVQSFMVKERRKKKRSDFARDLLPICGPIEVGVKSSSAYTIKLLIVYLFLMLINVKKK